MPEIAGMAMCTLLRLLLQIKVGEVLLGERIFSKCSLLGESSAALRLLSTSMRTLRQVKLMTLLLCSHDGLPRSRYSQVVVEAC